MSLKPHDRPRISLVSLMAIAAILGLFASLTIPGYMGQVLKTRQEECPKALQTLAAAQQTYQAQSGFYTNNLSELPWTPPAKPHYLYGFKPDGKISSLPGETTLNPAPFCAQGRCFTTEHLSHPYKILLQPQELPPSHFDPQAGYQVGCIGNLDPDAGIDQWSIDERGELTHVTDDLAGE